MGVKGEPGVASPAKDSAEGAKATSSKHAITVQFGNGQEDMTIKVKGTMRFAKIYDAIAGNRGVDPKSFRLVHDGRRIGQDDTPESLEFEEEETIDCHIEQTGGGQR